MKRLVVCIACLAFVAQPAMATSEFSKQWKAAYLDREKDPDFYKLAARTGCSVCHVKGEDKEEVRNEYGKAVHEYLKAEDFPKDWVKDNPEEAKRLILEGFKKANEHKSSDGEKFGDKIKAGKIPATDWEGK